MPFTGAGAMATPAAPKPINENLRYQPAEGVANDDRRGIQFPDDFVVLLDYFRDPQLCDSCGVMSEFVDIDVHAGPALRDDAETFLGVTLDPVFPTESCHPKSIDQHNRIRLLRHINFLSRSMFER
jgi:hypothetical protein